jgi:hypothetical protein
MTEGKNDEKDEIARLEQELAATKAELAAQQGPPLAEGADPFKGTPRRIFLIAILIFIIGVAMMWGVFTLLSKGFDSFANKAAESLTPQSAPNSNETPTPPPPSRSSPPSGTDKAPPRAPGL